MAAIYRMVPIGHSRHPPMATLPIKQVPLLTDIDGTQQHETPDMVLQSTELIVLAIHLIATK